MQNVNVNVRAPVPISSIRDGNIKRLSKHNLSLRSEESNKKPSRRHISLILIKHDIKCYFFSYTVNPISKLQSNSVITYSLGPTTFVRYNRGSF